MYAQAVWCLSSMWTVTTCGYGDCVPTVCAMHLHCDFARRTSTCSRHRRFCGASCARVSAPRCVPKALRTSNAAWQLTCCGASTRLMRIFLQLLRQHGPRSTRTCARSRGCCTWCSRGHHLPPLRQQVKVVWAVQSVMDAQCVTLGCTRRLPPGYPCPLILVDQLDLLDLVHALVSSQKPQHQHPPPWPQRLHPPSQLHWGPQTQRPRGQCCLKQRTPRRSWA